MYIHAYYDMYTKKWISTYIRNYSLEEEKRNINEILTSINPIIDFYGQYINGNILNDGLFSLAQILIRVCPYRIRANYNYSALVCLLHQLELVLSRWRRPANKPIRIDVA